MASTVDIKLASVSHKIIVFSTPKGKRVYSVDNTNFMMILQIFMMILQIFGFIIREHVSRLTCIDCKTNAGIERFFGTRAITGTKKLKG